MSTPIMQDNVMSIESSHRLPYFARGPTLIWGCPQRKKGQFLTIKEDKQDVFVQEKRTNKDKFGKKRTKGGHSGRS